MLKNFKTNNYENLVKSHLRFDTFEDLKSELLFLKNSKIENNVLKVIFNENFVITTKINLGFKTYINNVFYYNLDAPDVWEMLKELNDDIYVIVQYKHKHGFFFRNKFDFIFKNEYDIKRVKHINDVYMIFDIKGVIYQ
jgi:hypothetical protein